jgi:glucokinase
MILAADIGATNTRVGIFRTQGERLERASTQRFANRSYADFASLLRDFPADSGITGLAIGVAGPVFKGRANITNLRWDIDGALLQARYPGAHIALLNDVEATAYGITELQKSDLLELNAGTPEPDAPAALIASGTGLGEAVIHRHDSRHLVVASEGGHADFAPADENQVRLLRYLWRRFHPVSWDRVLSGPGLVLMYEFLRESGLAEESPAIAQRMHAGDPGAVITGAAFASECRICSAALQLFISVYGAEAGNFALRSLARGGVYLGGGIAPKIASKLSEGKFMEFFCAKDRMTDFLRTVPVYVVMNEDTALLGAARYATLQAASGATSSAIGR